MDQGMISSQPDPATNSYHNVVNPTPTTSSTQPPQATTNGDITASLQNAGQSALNTASATASSISNSQAVQDLKNGPVAQNVSNEASKTSSEFKDLYGSKQVPSEPAATGQSLTQYHSMFYRLLSWQNPRATGLTFAASVIFIFAARYLNILSYILWATYWTLGAVALLEVVGKTLFDDGLASKMRPRKYWTIPRESLERSLDDVEQLINFFVIESQRIVYAENVYATLAVFASAFVSFFLIKLVPFWGLALISTLVMYLGPLIYIKNRKAIDDGLEQVGSIVTTQASQIKNLTVNQTGRATESLKSYAGEYSNKAQELINSKKGSNTTTAGTTSTTSSSINRNDFPVAPKAEPATTTTLPGTPATVVSTSETEPLLAH